MSNRFPENRTKAYWDKKVPYPYQSKKVAFAEFLLMAVCAILGALSLWWLYPEDGFKIFFVLMSIACFLGYLVLQRGVLLSKLDEITGDTKTKELVFLGYGRIDDHDFISGLYPQDMYVYRLEMYYRVNRKVQIGNRILRCVMTEERHEELDELFFGEASLTPRKKGDKFEYVYFISTFILRPIMRFISDGNGSPIFLVTYTRFNKELLKIELAEGETYPESEEYKELLERVNIMF